MNAIVTEGGNRIEGILPNSDNTGLVDVIVTYGGGVVLTTLPKYFYFLNNLKTFV